MLHDFGLVLYIKALHIRLTGPNNTNYYCYLFINFFFSFSGTISCLQQFNCKYYQCCEAFIPPKQMLQSFYGLKTLLLFWIDILKSRAVHNNFCLFFCQFPFFFFLINLLDIISVSLGPISNFYKQMLLYLYIVLIIRNRDT